MQPLQCEEANNSQPFIKKIANTCGINVDIIDGEEEAAIIAATDTLWAQIETYLYVDVGGEVRSSSIINNGEKVLSKSFKIGTVRLLLLKKRNMAKS
jgi:exopolyphosphatase/guanosine-5'-triphosphate,3'-diphosphate pyrophosphatase